MEDVDLSLEDVDLVATEVTATAVVDLVVDIKIEYFHS
jgi:hypothetical protein